MDRIEPVGNPWLDAGIVPFSTISSNNQACNFESTKTQPLYLTDKKEWRKWFPVDFITESSLDNLRTGFIRLLQ
jgi:isoleucyl-tRNA synthetase